MIGILRIILDNLDRKDKNFASATLILAIIPLIHALRADGVGDPHGPRPEIYFLSC